jgi:SAM-dependent methyltransferase
VPEASGSFQNPRAWNDAPVPELSRHYAKLCDPADFGDIPLLQAVRSLIPEREPRDHVERKAWEMGQLAMFLEDAGRLKEDTEVLAIGAGSERVLFWVANNVRRVVATDVYGTGPFADAEADRSMLDNPTVHAPFPYREDHLEVRFMDARSLDFPDASFDAAFSLSSFEHFGGPGDIAAAARELGRVLKPGGHAFLAVDCFARRHPLDAAPVDFARRVGSLGRRYRAATPRRRAGAGEVLTPREIERLIVRPSGLELMQPLSLELSSVEPDPLMLLRAKRSLFTSAGLPLRKPG